MYLCLALAAGIAAAAVFTIRALSDAFAGFAGLFAIVALGQFVKDRRHSKYDLGVLQRIHEKAELDAIDVPQPEEFDSVRCRSCGTVYRMTLPACPRCGLTQFS